MEAQLCQGASEQDEHRPGRLSRPSNHIRPPLGRGQTGLQTQRTGVEAAGANPPRRALAKNRCETLLFFVTSMGEGGTAGDGCLLTRPLHGRLRLPGGSRQAVCRLRHHLFRVALSGIARRAGEQAIACEPCCNKARAAPLEERQDEQLGQPSPVSSADNLRGTRCVGPHQPRRQLVGR
jgi:hypothetical protein